MIHWYYKEGNESKEYNLGKGFGAEDIIYARLVSAFIAAFLEKINIVVNVFWYWITFKQYFYHNKANTGTRQSYFHIFNKTI